MQRYFIYLAYDGTAYHGWQIQPNGDSVQECLMRALATLMRREVEVIGAGRTDAGVHANRFCMNFHTDHPIPLYALKRSLNALLPDDIGVLDCREVPVDFHARYSCTGKRYIALHRHRRHPRLLHT